jgi:hypothetical protein
MHHDVCKFLQAGHNSPDEKKGSPEAECKHTVKIGSPTPFVFEIPVLR